MADIELKTFVPRPSAEEQYRKRRESLVVAITSFRRLRILDAIGILYPSRRRWAQTVFALQELEQKHAESRMWG
jgi:hypothetical protein